MSLNIDDRLLIQLTPAELAVLLNLTKRINKDRQCFPSYELLMSESGMGKGKLSRTLKSLKDKNLITWENRTRDNNGKKSNLYTVLTKMVGNYNGRCKIIDYSKPNFNDDFVVMNYFNFLINYDEIPYTELKKLEPPFVKWLKEELDRIGSKFISNMDATERFLMENEHGFKTFEKAYEEVVDNDLPF